LTLKGYYSANLDIIKKFLPYLKIKKRDKAFQVIENL
jgi:hypothetical protein